MCWLDNVWDNLSLFIQYFRLVDNRDIKIYVDGCDVQVMISEQSQGRI